MSATQQEFAFSQAAEPHRDRTKSILRAHPEIRELIGPNPTTFWWTLGIVLVQITAAALVARQAWWVVFLVAYTVGAFANHALFVMIHECTHKLVFKKKLPNILTGLLADVPLFFPSSVSFAKYHLKHHAFQGVYELDADLPSRWEARLVGHSVIGKALWLLLYPFFQMLRSYRIKEVAVIDGWTLANLASNLAVNAAAWIVFGPKAVAYFALSLFFSIGLHPLGARWIQRHYTTTDGDQETFSYYGRLNTVAFNVGYHNEHHDFPSVAWDKLPQIKAKVPEVYDAMAAHQSWTRLFFRFLLDRELSLWSRVVRRERNRVALNAEVKPDVDAIEEGSTAVAR